MSSSVLRLQGPVSLQQTALFPFSKLALAESKKTGSPADRDSSPGTRFTHAPQNTLLHLFVLEMFANALYIQFFHIALLSMQRQSLEKRRVIAGRFNRSYLVSHILQ